MEAELQSIRELQARGDLAGAEAALDGLARAQGPAPRLTHFRGMLHAAAGKPDSAEHLIRQGLVENPRDPLQLSDFGAFLAAQGRFEEALDPLLAATELAPNYAPARANLGALRLAAGKVEEAVSHLRAALALDPAHMEARTNLARAHISLGNKDAAIDLLFETVALARRTYSATSTPRSI